MEMAGWSMAPWLKPGDVLLVDRSVPVAGLRVGSVVVMKVGEGRVVHRIVGRNRSRPSFPFSLKGDRNAERDPIRDDWAYEGLVVERIRAGKRSCICSGAWMAWWSSAGLYPGQRIPKWLSRSSLARFFL